jgi:hypothetical protein
MKKNLHEAENTVRGLHYRYTQITVKQEWYAYLPVCKAAGPVTSKREL